MDKYGKKNASTPKDWADGGVAAADGAAAEPMAVVGEEKKVCLHLAPVLIVLQRKHDNDGSDSEKTPKTDKKKKKKDGEEVCKLQNFDPMKATPPTAQAAHFNPCRPMARRRNPRLPAPRRRRRRTRRLVYLFYFGLFGYLTIF